MTSDEPGFQVRIGSRLPDTAIILAGHHGTGCLLRIPGQARGIPPGLLNEESRAARPLAKFQRGLPASGCEIQDVMAGTGDPSRSCHDSSLASAAAEY